MTVKLKNNTFSTLRTAIDDTTTTVVVASGHGARFPSLGVGEYFYATLEGSGGDYETVKVTARSVDTLTVIRASEGTIARAFTAGSAIEMRVTAQGVLDAATDAAATLTLADLDVTATATELNVLDGITATTAELNTLDGVTATATELNVLDGVTATATELNVLDGITATTAELNYTDGVTSPIQTQLDAITTDASIANSVSITGGVEDWTFVVSGNNLIIKYGATNLAKLDTTGHLTVKGDITAFGTLT